MKKKKQVSVGAIILLIVVAIMIYFKAKDASNRGKVESINFDHAEEQKGP